VAAMASSGWRNAFDAVARLLTPLSARHWLQTTAALQNYAELPPLLRGACWRRERTDWRVNRGAVLGGWHVQRRMGGGRRQQCWRRLASLATVNGGTAFSCRGAVTLLR